MAEKYEAILLAAGSAKRFNHPDQMNKLLMPLGDRPVFDYSLRILLNDEKCLKIWFVINPDNQVPIKKQVKTLYTNIPEKIHWVLGGEERQDSVSLALSQVSCSESEKVLVHDAARPFITEELIANLVDKSNDFVAVTLGIPAKDTIKRVRDGRVYQSLFRPEIWHIQTPQIFNCNVLVSAIRKAEQECFYGNEETELVERLGYPVEVIEGSDHNFKLTTAFDYRIAEMLMKNDGSGR